MRRLMVLATGDPVPPDLALVDADGAEVRLSSFRGETAVLIFLRHLG